MGRNLTHRLPWGILRSTVICSTTVVTFTAAWLSMCLFSAKCLESFNLKAGLKVFGVLAPLSSLLTLFSPSGSVIGAVRKGRHDLLPIRLAQAGMLNNILTINYGLRMRILPIVVANATGLACQLVFAMVHQHLRLSVPVSDECSKPMEPSKRLKAWAQFFASYSLSLFGLSYWFSILTVSTVGVLLTFANILFFFAPCLNVVDVIVQRNSEKLPPSITLAMVLQNTIWTLYSKLLDDIVILLPSIVCLAIALFQFLVLIWLWFNPPCLDFSSVVNFTALLGVSQTTGPKVKGGMPMWPSRDFPDVSFVTKAPQRSGRQIELMEHKDHTPPHEEI